MNARTLCALASCLCLVALTGCASLGFGGGEVGEPDYASDAETNLVRGDEALEDNNFLEAEKYFEYVKQKYPFLDAAKTAELRLADTDFERDRFVEARDRYQSFIKLHPTHSRVDYAAFRSALTHSKEMPSDFFVLPSSREKDQGEIRATLKAMNDFLRAYPKSEHVAEAQKSADEAKRRLAEHELYVASFYRNREKWPAVVGRLNNVVNNYSGVGFDEEALFGLHDAYLKLADKARAEETLRTIITKLPGTDAAARAQKLLGS